MLLIVVLLSTATIPVTRAAEYEVETNTVVLGNAEILKTVKLDDNSIILLLKLSDGGIALAKLNLSSKEIEWSKELEDLVQVFDAKIINNKLVLAGMKDEGAIDRLVLVKLDPDSGNVISILEFGLSIVYSGVLEEYELYKTYITVFVIKKTSPVRDVGFIMVEDAEENLVLYMYSLDSSTSVDLSVRDFKIDNDGNFYIIGDYGSSEIICRITPVDIMCKKVQFTKLDKIVVEDSKILVLGSVANSLLIIEFDKDLNLLSSRKVEFSRLDFARVNGVIGLPDRIVTAVTLYNSSSGQYKTAVCEISEDNTKCMSVMDDAKTIDVEYYNGKYIISSKNTVMIKDSISGDLEVSLSNVDFEEGYLGDFKEAKSRDQA